MMDTVSYKSGIFLAYQLLDALYSGDLQVCPDNIQIFGDWCADNHDALSKEPEFAVICEPLAQLMRRLCEGETVSMRECNALRPLLVELLASWVNKVKFRLYLQPDVPSSVAVFVRGETPVTAVTGSYSAIPDTGDGKIHILLADNAEDVGDTSGKIDGIITLEELSKRAQYCFPADGFDYDRLYLSGKLKSLAAARNDVSIILGGSSYAMVGLKESLMPRPAVNLAVNAQDPYFALLSFETAKELCGKINTAVIVAGYYFWHTDMSDNPSDYYKSVLTRTNYPVLKSLHNYRGDLLSPMQRGQSDPFMEKIFDLGRICEELNGRISEKLASLDYYNSEINPRPENGMLGFPFREQSDEVNEKAAKARAQAHNGNFSCGHLEANMEALSAFLQRMKEKQVKVILVISPVTAFYRQFSAPELKASLYEMLEPVKKEYDFTFLDLFGSPDFDIHDFKDYDHLNDQGAEKLSGIIAALI